MKPASEGLPKRGPRLRERGIATVEFAIILPLFGILLLGTLEIGSMARDHQALQNGAREGARFSAMFSNKLSGHTAAQKTQITANIQSRVVQYLANERITVAPASVAVNQAYNVVAAGTNLNCSQITVTYTRPVLFPGIARWVPLSSTLTARAVFKNLY